MSKVPPFINRMLRRPPILADEDLVEYQDLFDTIWQEELPQTVQEWMLVADITAEEWEILRLRGLKPRALHAVLLDALIHDMATGDAVRVDLIHPRPSWLAEFRRGVIGVKAGDVAAKLQVEEFLKQHGHTIDSLVASAFAYKMPTQVAADRLLEAAYRRRNAFYADLERVRSKVRRPDGLPTKAVESPPIAPSSEPITTQTEARGDVVDDGSDRRPSPPEESVS
jgi:hypothetical protein